jgi:phage gp45-like
MSNPLRDAILNDIIRPELIQTNKTYLGTIESFDSVTCTATVKYEEETYKNVPIINSAGGVYGNTPTSGTPVIMSFLGGDRSYPYVVTIINNGGTDTSTGKTYMMPDSSMTP